MTGIIIAAVLVCAAAYLLYENGYAVTQMKRAVMYVESAKGRKASFSACSGYTRRIVKFAESRNYHFTFAPELNKGEMSAELLNSKKEKLLTLDGSKPSADIYLENGVRYYLVYRFKSASGKYELNWE